ncbi:four-carbon acid sugar kinase family protein [Virgibacillus kimchii]
MNDNNLLLAFYGDDFTGSTDAMEALAAKGYRTILFTEIPTIEMIQQFENLKCIGIAGTSRAKNTEEMENELKPIYNILSKLNVPVVHYKTCSTFDSSPKVGSIGKAIDLAKQYFDNKKATPLLVATPKLGRYTLFGQHFARMKDIVYRLDRHPVMSKHPVTPMDEADLRKHLKKQIQSDIGLLDIIEMNKEDVDEIYESKSQNYDILLIDALNEKDVDTAGRLIWDASKNNTVFTVGSSGIEDALASNWNRLNVPRNTDQVNRQDIKSKENILVVSGSGSVITKEQIKTALRNGFEGIKVNSDILTGDYENQKNFINKVVNLLNDKKNVILYTALGPDDDSIFSMRNKLKENGIQEMQIGEFIGKKLGGFTNQILKNSSINRIVLAGGDTSGFITKELDVFGLEMIQQVSPGAPLCRVYSKDIKINGIELALKGGQLGGDNYFHEVLNVNNND